MMLVEHPAHIREAMTEGAPAEVQTVRQHCEAAARYAEGCLAPMGAGISGRFAALIHDCGKCKREMEDYLWKVYRGERPERGSVNHTFAAVKYLLENMHGPDSARPEDVACELLAYAAGAHHGLFDCVGERLKLGFADRADREGIFYEESINNFFNEVISREELNELYKASVAELLEILEKLVGISACKLEMSFGLGMMARMLLSAVIEGDRRDTAEFMKRIEFPSPEAGNAELWQNCLARVEEKLSALPCETPIQAARRNISAQCRKAAERPGGIYRLDLPTGSGKTLASLRYSLAHAAEHDKQRIFFVLPLLSITEQNAAVIRDYVGNDSIILEHHSNAVQTEKDARDELDEHELICENWRSPIVITTLVQMLNTMFSGKTAAVRRFQALCGSVIVFDEVQSVPVKMLSQFNMTLTFLSEVCGATIILCSATQPCFEAAFHPVRAHIDSLIPADRERDAVFARTKLTDAGSMRLDEIAPFAERALEKTDSLLVVCNMKRQARELYKRLSPLGNVYHLSASMCAAHRQDTLKEIREKLGRERVICVSTQVIEAGVDISFGCVVRLTAGMDSVVQSAGRCNRNGEADGLAPVYLVSCCDEDLRRLRDIETGKNITMSMLDEYGRSPERFDGDISSARAIERYYRDLFSATKWSQDYPVDDPRDTLVSLLSTNDNLCEGLAAKDNRYYLRQAFKLAGSLFKVFDDESTAVLVRYGEGEKYIAELCSERAKHDPAYVKEVLKKAKFYTVSVYGYQRELLEQMGATEKVSAGEVLVLKPGYYSNEVGLNIEAGKFEFLEV